MLFRNSAYSRTSWSHFINVKNAVLNGEQEKESINRMRILQKNPSVDTNVLPSLDSDANKHSWDRFFYPTLKLTMDSYMKPVQKLHSFHTLQILDICLSLSFS